MKNDFFRIIQMILKKCLLCLLILSPRMCQRQQACAAESGPQAIWQQNFQRWQYLGLTGSDNEDWSQEPQSSTSNLPGKDSACRPRPTAGPAPLQTPPPAPAAPPRPLRRSGHLLNMVRVSVMPRTLCRRLSSLCGSSFRNRTASTSIRRMARILFCKVGNSPVGQEQLVS